MNAKNLWLKFAAVGLLVAVCLFSLFMGNGLRQGIDLRGGHRLIFEIRTNDSEITRLGNLKKEQTGKLQATDDADKQQEIRDLLARIDTDLDRLKSDGTNSGNLAQKMIAILKERVDPSGLRSLEWTPLGNSRIEVRMPAGKVDTQEKRDAYFRVLEKLEENNIQRSEVRSVLQLPASERAAKIDLLTAGDGEQKKRFESLLVAHDKMVTAEQDWNQTKIQREKAVEASSSLSKITELDKLVAVAEAKFQNSTPQYEDSVDALREGNISPQHLQEILGNFVTRAEEGIRAERVGYKRLSSYTNSGRAFVSGLTIRPI